VTYLFVPKLTGEDLAREDAEFAEFLATHGWEGEVGEDDGEHLIRAITNDKPTTV